MSSRADIGGTSGGPRLVPPDRRPRNPGGATLTLPAARWKLRASIGRRRRRSHGERTMQQYGQEYVGGGTVAAASVDERAAFIVRTYLHLVGAVFAFVILEAALITSGLAGPVLNIM